MFLKDFTPPEILEKVQPNTAVTHIVTVNGKPLEYLCVDHQGTACPLSSMETGCTVHTGNPITCMFPLVHFRQYRKENINILIGHFGRNWKMGCPVQFRPYNSAQEFNDRVLSRFERMIEYLDTIGVEHRGSDIMRYLCAGRDQHIGKTVFPGFNIV